MKEQQLSLSECIHYDLLNQNVDIEETLDVIDYFEEKCNKDMDMVSYLTNVYIGIEKDLIIIK